MQRFVWLSLLLLLSLLWLIRHSVFVLVTIFLHVRRNGNRIGSLGFSLAQATQVDNRKSRIDDRCQSGVAGLPTSLFPLSLSLSACLSMNLVFLLRACNYSWARRGGAGGGGRGRVSKAEHLLHKLKLKLMCGQSYRNILRNVSQYSKWNI